MRVGKRICSEFEGVARFVAHAPVVERLNEAAEAAPLRLPAEEDIGADVEIVGQCEVLIDRLDADAARVHRRRELGLLAVENDFAFVRMIDAGHAFDERRFARAVVAEKADHFALVDVEAHLVDGDEAAEDFGQGADR